MWAIALLKPHHRLIVRYLVTGIIKTKQTSGRWISWFPQRWSTQRIAICSVNCRAQWIIKSLNANRGMVFGLSHVWLRRCYSNIPNHLIHLIWIGGCRASHSSVALERFPWLCQFREALALSTSDELSLDFAVRLRWSSLQCQTSRSKPIALLWTHQLSLSSDKRTGWI